MKRLSDCEGAIHCRIFSCFLTAKSVRLRGAELVYVPDFRGDNLSVIGKPIFHKYTHIFSLVIMIKTYFGPGVQAPHIPALNLRSSAAEFAPETLRCFCWSPDFKETRIDSALLCAETDEKRLGHLEGRFTGCFAGRFAGFVVLLSVKTTLPKKFDF